MTQKHICPLCDSLGEDFYNDQFQKCTGCWSIFRKKEYYPLSDEEKSRYEEHNNDITDTWYQNFVLPIVNNILKEHTLHQDWLDFWAGTWPVISHLLWKQWYNICLYDPFFHNHPELLEQKYDYIIACEVVEHFHNPRKEFKLLYSLVKPGGSLYIMTDLYSPEIDFHNWYYKNDKTHVFFYSNNAFEWIKNTFKWKHYSREKRCIILKK